MDNTATQLRSLATENRTKADFFDLAADLQEKGYQSDQEVIAKGIEDGLAPLQTTIVTLTQLLQDNNIPIPTP